MPKKRNRRKKKEISSVIEANLPDVSIQDFANTVEKEQFKGLSKKKMTSKSPGKVLEKSPNLAEELPWYSREDFDDVFCEENSDDEMPQSISDSENQDGLSPLTEPRLPSQDNSQVDYSKLYPDDVWYCVSEYILPENILTFALICKGSNRVVNTKAFWMHVYKRFILEFSHNLPAQLQPLYVQSHPGLKSRVVRALFHVYEPLKSKLNNVSRWTDQSVGLIQSAVCSLVWYQQALLNKETKVWIFYFKLKYIEKSHPGVQLRPYSCEWFEKADYISENPEINKCILQVTALNFIQIPSVVGLLITGLFINVSRGMQYNIVKITFHNQRRDKKYHQSNGIQVILDPVRDVQILNWWNPRYPHSDRLNSTHPGKGVW